MTRPSAAWRSVLIVDDDRDTREMYSESLRADGFHILTATSGEAAVHLAATATPAVIVTDLRLGASMDGVELARRLRADSRTRGVRIIMLTGATFGDEQQRAEAAGCDRFLLKPCLPADLASEIRRLAMAEIRPRDEAEPLRAEPRARPARDNRQKP
jgi:CheY-like chemotaxis protein